MDGLGWVDAERIIEKLGSFEDKQLILVGGQALNFWQKQFAGSLANSTPLASKDIDFCADESAVKACALKLGGKPHLPSRDDQVRIQTGKVVFLDSRRVQRTIDFLECPYGLKLKDVKALAIAGQLLKEDGSDSGVRLWVLHPIHCMFSRVANCMGLPGYETDHATNQLRLSVACARAFLEWLLEDPEGVRPALLLCERIYHYCHDRQFGRDVPHKLGIDPFDAVPATDSRLPLSFRERRYPQMRCYLRLRRARAARSRRA